MNTLRKLDRLSRRHIWDEQPVFCFTSDVDWASEYVLEHFFSTVNKYGIKPTIFCTHESKQVAQQFDTGKIERGIHPNFLPGSDQGNCYVEVIGNCMAFAPETRCFRSHRAFDVTDISHILKNEHDFKFCSNYITVMQPFIRPLLHESGLINFPVFFEDGSHLYNELDLKFNNWIKHFSTPGIKIISFHPMNFTFNSPSLAYMRNIKDTLSREQYKNINEEIFLEHRNKADGIRYTMMDLIHWVLANEFPVYTLNSLFEEIFNKDTLTEILLNPNDER